MRPDVCKHGSLRRKCDICDLSEEVAELRSALREISVQTIVRYQGETRIEQHNTCLICNAIVLPEAGMDHDPDCLTR